MKYLILVLVFLSSAVLVSAQIVEPFVFTRHKERVTITWVSDPVMVQEAIDKWEKTNPGTDIIGLAKWSGSRCTIYALEPKYEADENMITLGHELLHCFRGSYHE